MIGELLLRHKHLYRFAGHGMEGEVWECDCGDWVHRPCIDETCWRCTLCGEPVPHDVIHCYLCQLRWQEDAEYNRRAALGAA